MITPDFSEVMVCNGDSDDISVVDTKTLTVVRALQPGPDPETLALSPDGATIYVSNEDDSMVTLLDAKSGASIARIPVAMEPERLAISVDGKTVVGVSESTKHGVFHRCADAHRRRQCPRRHAAYRRMSADGATLYAVNGLTNDLSVIDVPSLRVTRSVPVGRLPWGLAIKP